LNKTKRKVIVNEILSDDKSISKRDQDLSYLRSQSRHYEEEKMSVDSLSVISGDSTASVSDGINTGRRYLVPFDQVNKRKGASKLVIQEEDGEYSNESNDDFGSDDEQRYDRYYHQRASVTKLPINDLNTSNTSLRSSAVRPPKNLVVDVQNLNKKNDYLFFELFSVYTNQVINNSS
jgi:hypothetical protein